MDSVISVVGLFLVFCHMLYCVSSVLVRSYIRRKGIMVNCTPIGCEAIRAVAVHVGQAGICLALAFYGLYIVLPAVVFDTSVRCL